MSTEDSAITLGSESLGEGEGLVSLYVLAISGAMADGLCSVDAGEGSRGEEGDGGGDQTLFEECAQDDGEPVFGDDDDNSLLLGSQREHSGNNLISSSDLPRRGPSVKDQWKEEGEEETGVPAPMAPLGHVGFGWGAPAVICRRLGVESHHQGMADASALPPLTTARSSSARLSAQYEAMLLVDDGDSYWSDHGEEEEEIKVVDEGRVHDEAWEPSSEDTAPLATTFTAAKLLPGEANMSDPSTAMQHSKQQHQGIGGWFSSAIKDIWH